MKRFRSVTALLLAGILLFSSFGCAQNNANEETGTVAAENPTEALTAETEEATEEEDVKAVLSRLPDDNFEGYEFVAWGKNFVNATLSIRQIPDEEMNGEPINDALWVRDRAVEDKYNIRLTYVIPELNGLDLFSDASKLILAGDASMSLMYGAMANGEAPNFLSQRLILDMTSIPNVDLSQPYWSQNANKDLAVKGMVFLCTGDITTRYAGAPYLILFNKQLFNDYGYAYPYDDVRAGTWTFDQLEAMTKDTFRDLNGDGKTTNKDFFGYVSESRNTYAFYKGFGYDTIQLNGDEAILSCAEENAVNAAGRIGAYYALPDMFRSSIVYEETDIFKEDRSIFVGQTACNLTLLTDMETDFGVLPSPKEDEEQDKYYSYVNPHCATAVMVPKSAENLGRIGTVVEALAAASRVTSMKEAYEVTLQYRQTRDEDSVEMLRLASEAAIYDLAEIYGWGSIQPTVEGAMWNNQGLAAKLKSCQRVAQKAVDKFIGSLTAGD